MKEGSEEVAETESKSCLPRMVTQMPPSLATVNLTLLLSHKQRQTNLPATDTVQRVVHGSFVTNKREGKQRHYNELHVVLQSPRRPTDR